jgi:hypothetical protein
MVVSWPAPRTGAIKLAAGAGQNFGVLGRYGCGAAILGEARCLQRY